MRLFVYDGRRSRDPFLNLAVEAHLMERVPKNWKRRAAIWHGGSPAAARSITTKET